MKIANNLNNTYAFCFILICSNQTAIGVDGGGEGGGGRGGLTEGSEIKSRLPGLVLICSVCSSYLLPPRRIETVSVKYCEMMSNRLGITSRWTING